MSCSRALLLGLCLLVCSCVVPVPVGRAMFFVIIIPTGDSPEAVISRAHRSRFRCGTARVRKLRRNHYLATGCGPDRTYTCHSEGLRTVCKQDVPDFSKSPASVLVERMHQQTYGCKVVSAWYVRPGLYEARGCAPRKYYSCGVYEDGVIMCKPYVAGDPLPPLPPPKKVRKTKKAPERTRWR